MTGPLHSTRLQSALRLPPRRGMVGAWVAVSLLLGGALGSRGLAQEAQWVWSAEQPQNKVPQGSCHFRKSFTLRAPEAGQISITADDTYELYVNGRKVASGESSKRIDKYDVSKHLVRGANTISLKVTNLRGSTAAVAARVTVKERGHDWKSYSTDATWKASTHPLPLWNTQLYNDRSWDPAQALGRLGETPPWDRAEDVAQEKTDQSERFQISDAFAVSRVVEGDETGSLIAMTFNEFGHIIASRENGPLLLIYDSNEDEQLDKVRVYCSQVTNCHGILALNGEVFATGDGPDGNALYRLTDTDRNGTLETVRPLIKFKCEVSEHGAHGIVLGADGLLYVMVGNHATPANPYDPSSPHRGYYEGDLLQPRYEDPGGHAAGIKAPGGVVLRTDIDGNSVQLVAGGLRNAYDLAINHEGELFAHDSDMESDEGMTWYYPTSLFQIVPGGEYGWRSGWARWPDYFVDSLPPLAETGRGSPTGCVVYNHHMFPTSYHNALFLADWSEGRILSVKLKNQGGTYSANPEVFLQGSPLNVTDLDVGPDGGLYFVTGGRGTSGGVYQVRWKGQVPESVRNTGEGITAVIRQPQLHSAWSRQKIARQKKQLGDRWNDLILGVARAAENPAHYRTRALDVMQLFGPTPDPDLLIELTKDKNELVRAKAAEFLGMHADDRGRQQLVTLLDDGNRTVRRKACEALARTDYAAPVERLLELAASEDRQEAWAARRLLERQPVDQWRETVLQATDQRKFTQGALALLVGYPSKENALAVIQSIRRHMQNFVSDQDFIDMLRLAQVALCQGEVRPEELSEFREALAEEFPAGNNLMNRELVRLLAYLQVSTIMDRYIEYLTSDAPDIEKLHVALHLRFIESGWNADQKLQLLKFYEGAQKLTGGSSFTLYVIHFTRDLCKSLTEEEVEAVLATGTEWPNAALGSLYRLPEKLTEKQLQLLKGLDTQLLGQTGETYDRLRIGMVAVMARSGDASSMKYLREVWLREPERRPTVAMGLAQQPDGENWPFLIRSLPVLEGAAAAEVIGKLRTVNQRPEDPEHIRQVILCGLRLGPEAAKAAELLQFWTGEHPSSNETNDDAPPNPMAAWQSWFSQAHPKLPPAELPKAAENSKWQFSELSEYLASEEGSRGSAARGANVFTKAQCIKCHRFGDKGESMGPDLTSVSRRFTKKETLESILYPSYVISSQYASKTVVTTDGRKLTGILAAGAPGEKVLLDPQGQKVILAEDDIEEVVPSKVSGMPEGLLDGLSLEEISDLFAYLNALPTAAVSRNPK